MAGRFDRLLERKGKSMEFLIWIALGWFLHTKYEVKVKKRRKPAKKV
jgi:hypothetical protein